MNAAEDSPAQAGDTTQVSGAESERVFLVVLDNSVEMRVALQFACLRARRTGGRVAFLFVQEPADFQHWVAVGDLMREEAREEGEEMLQRLSADALKWAGSLPIYYMREGDRREELFSLLEEEPSISVVVLAASDGPEGPGPIISYVLGKGAGRLHIPITIVPGSLTEEEIDALT